MEFLNQYNPSLSNYQLFISLIKKKFPLSPSSTLPCAVLCCECRVVGQVRGDNGSWWFIWHILYISFFYFLSKNKHKTENIVAKSTILLHNANHLIQQYFFATWTTRKYKRSIFFRVLISSNNYKIDKFSIISVIDGEESFVSNFKSN